MVRIEDRAEPIRFKCSCGRKGSANLKRYELVRCKCGQFYWALRPKRDGPLVAYLWPGERHLIA